MNAVFRSTLAAVALTLIYGARSGAAEPAFNVEPAAQPQTAAPSATVAAAPAARVDLFSPRGSAKQVRQATARFSVPMVALGDPRLADPFDVTCGAPGKGRWADGRNWVYDFDADLQGGLRCSFTLRKALTALDGRAISGTRTFTFDTGGPSVQSAFPAEGWSALDEEQVFLLKLDAPATVPSVLASAYCVVDGISERVPVEVLSGEARAAVLAQRKQLGYAYYQLLWKNGEVSQARVRDRTLEQAEDLITVLKCQRRLPQSTKVQLVWGAGIAAASGVATRSPQRLAFEVRAAFTARLECIRTEPRAGCTPTQPITVQFSAPVARAQAMAARLRISASDVHTPDASDNRQAKVVDSVTFKPPFPDGATASLELPAQLSDDAARPLENASRFPLEVRIDEYPPLVKFSSEFGILEAAEGGVLPVTLRNIDAAGPGRDTSIAGRQFRVGNNPAAIADWLRRVHEANAPRGEYVRDEAAGTSKWREDT
ncbi:MAG TPA: hypothetical protein VGO53_10695, partial [Steroidobacteraceae bacterium]|nr:hypothetical protein [Steroidobacteraceae bacterium]